MHWTPEREFWNRNLAESFLDKTLLLTVPLSTEENKWIPSNFSKNPGEMQRVKISDGPASRPDVAVLSVISCYTVRNRFQCLVGHLDRVQILPLPSLLPCQTMTVDHFHDCHMKLSYETSIGVLRQDKMKILKEPITPVVLRCLLNF